MDFSCEVSISLFNWLFLPPFNVYFPLLKITWNWTGFRYHQSCIYLLKFSIEKFSKFNLNENKNKISFNSRPKPKDCFGMTSPMKIALKVVLLPVVFLCAAWSLLLGGFRSVFFYDFFFNFTFLFYNWIEGFRFDFISQSCSLVKCLKHCL